MSSQQEEKATKAENVGNLVHLLNHVIDSMPSSSTLTVLDRYTALRNHRIRFQDALDPNAERVAALRKDDIILGRGKNMQDYPGNRRMRSIINKYKHEYQSIQRSEKRDLVESVYKEITQGGGRFLTKATNEKYFVLVDIEVALQKVSNTLRCRKNRNKVAVAIGTEMGIEEKASASFQGNRSSVSRDKLADVAISNQKRAIRSASSSSSQTVAPPLVMGNRSQTMSLLRENTVRLMKKMPLLPATLNDLCYLQHCQSLQRSYPGSVVSFMREHQSILNAGGANARLPRMASSTAERASHEVFRDRG
ncbi:unnamed protein product [Cylindrotheca closterium]|uniref:DUF6824 domain-containing protein n=1 Tax=Cylindrotheca closterium TaxID=2856 RepID=A0AAD2JHW6_9STRA|nr:unnamed protein product [Cylindrotheca closterium]